MKRFITFCVVFLILFYFGYHYIKSKTREIDSKSGFRRNYHDIKITPLGIIKLPEVTGFCGVFNGKIYYNKEKLSNTIFTDLNLSTSSNIKFTMDPKDSLTINCSAMYRNFIYKLDVNKKTLVKEDIENKVSSLFSLPKYISRLVPLSENTFIVRAKNDDGNDQSLYKFNLIENSLNNRRDITNVKSDDMGLISGGTLSYDLEIGLVTYTSYYNNRITIYDTNLNVITQGRSIDTFNHPRIKAKVSYNGDSKETTSYGPVKFTNTFSCAYGRKLFVLSDVRAENESVGDYYDNNIIDVYELPSLHYKGSIRIEKIFSGEKYNKIMVHGDILYIYNGIEARGYVME